MTKARLVGTLAKCTWCLLLFNRKYHPWNLRSLWLCTSQMSQHMSEKEVLCVWNDTCIYYMKWLSDAKNVTPLLHKSTTHIALVVDFQKIIPLSLNERRRYSDSDIGEYIVSWGLVVIMRHCNINMFLLKVIWPKIICSVIAGRRHFYCGCIQ